MGGVRVLAVRARGVGGGARLDPHRRMVKDGRWEQRAASVRNRERYAAGAGSGALVLGEAAMLFMVIENFHAGQALAVYRRFHERGRMAPEGVRYISSWVDLEFRRCFQVMEAA